MHLYKLFDTKNKTYFFPPRTNRVGGDGVGVLGVGGRGDHGSSTSASRAAAQLDFLEGQRRYGRLRCSETRDLACVPPPKPSRTSKMASSRPKSDPYQQKQLSPVDLAEQPATPSAQNATTKWAFSPARPSNFSLIPSPSLEPGPKPILARCCCPSATAKFPPAEHKIGL